MCHLKNDLTADTGPVNFTQSVVYRQRLARA